MSQPDDSYKKALTRLFDAFDDAAKTDQELDEYLEDSAIDVEKLVQDGVQEFGELKGRLRLQFARKRKNLLQQANQKLSQYTEDVDDPIKAIMQLFSDPNQRELQIFFSKIESLDEDDALQLLDDNMLLEIIDGLDKKEDE